MTIQELYDWAVENDVANCDLVVRDSFGSTTHDIQPEILTHYTGYFEVEL